MTRIVDGLTGEDGSRRGAESAEKEKDTGRVVGGTPTTATGTVAVPETEDKLEAAAERRPTEI